MIRRTGIETNAVRETTFESSLHNSLANLALHRIEKLEPLSADHGNRKFYTNRFKGQSGNALQGCPRTKVCCAPDRQMVADFGPDVTPHLTRV
jgi:hypothetical protein